MSRIDSSSRLALGSNPACAACRAAPRDPELPDPPAGIWTDVSASHALSAQAPGIRLLPRHEMTSSRAGPLPRAATAVLRPISRRPDGFKKRGASLQLRPSNCCHEMLGAPLRTALVLDPRNPPSLGSPARAPPHRNIAWRDPDAIRRRRKTLGGIPNRRRAQFGADATI
jgi:hypothetical protein